jgi:8-oxo-dGTP diphosphatase
MVKKYSVLVNGAVVQDNKLLIIKRSQKEKHQAGMWCLPGGKMESSEEIFPLEHTAIRELLEETGIDIITEKMIYNNVFEHSEDKQPTLAIVFLCKVMNGRAIPLEDTEEVRWITKEEIDNFKFPPNVKDYIKLAFAYETLQNRSNQE